MKQKIKKLLGLALTLLITFPVLAATPSQEAQSKLEDQIFTLLQTGKYEQVKTTLSNIPVCPENEKVTEKQIPAKCTMDKFNPDPFEMKDSGKIDITIRAVLPENTKYTTPVTLTVVRPVAALKNSLAREYQERFGKNISEYDETGYVQFPKPYKGSWLENVVPSVLAEQIWKGIKGTYQPQIGRVFYNDVKWHEAQGITYDQAAEIKYANISNDVRYHVYKPCNDARAYNLFNLAYSPFDYIYHFAKENNDEAFQINYSKNIYYDLFTINSFVSNLNNRFGEGLSIEEYVAVLVNLFHRHWIWERYAVDMPEELLKEMQDNVTKYVPSVCVQQTTDIRKILDAYHEGWTWSKDYYEEIKYDPNDLCENFIKNAKEYGLWTKEAQKKYDELRREKRKVERNIIIQQVLKGVEMEAQRISY